MTLMPTFDPLFVWGNYVEGAFWIVLGTVLLVRGRSHWIGPAALLAFGVSDFVETRTGGWYTPWWMLTWKTICVLILSPWAWTLYRASRRGKLSAKTQSPS
jgi:hypothetical protein